MFADPQPRPTKRGRRTIGAGTLAAGLLAWIAPFHAAAAPAADDTVAFASTPLLSDAELSTMRGGFAVAGMEVRFGATVHTYIDGALALETVLSVAPDGSWVAESVRNNLPAGSDWTFVSPENPIAGTPRFAELLAGSRGLVKTTSGRTTMVLQLLPSGGPANIIVNEAAGADVLQTMNLDIALGNHAALADQANRMRAMEFGRIGQQELINALPR